MGASAPPVQGGSTVPAPPNAWSHGLARACRVQGSPGLGVVGVAEASSGSRARPAGGSIAPAPAGGSAHLPLGQSHPRRGSGVMERRGHPASSRDTSLCLGREGSART